MSECPATHPQSAVLCCARTLLLALACPSSSSGGTQLPKKPAVVARPLPTPWGPSVSSSSASRAAGKASRSGKGNPAPSAEVRTKMRDMQSADWVLEGLGPGGFRVWGSWRVHGGSGHGGFRYLEGLHSLLHCSPPFPSPPLQVTGRLPPVHPPAGNWPPPVRTTQPRVPERKVEDSKVSPGQLARVGGVGRAVVAECVWGRA